jgi:hypothetical protein
MKNPCLNRIAGVILRKGDIFTPTVNSGHDGVDQFTGCISEVHARLMPGQPPLLQCVQLGR